MRHFITKRCGLLTLILMAAASVMGGGYQLPNSGFEVWDRSWNGKPQPQSWNLSNVEQFGYKFNIGSQCTDAHSGSYSVMCKAESVGAFGITDVAPSWITLGTPWSYVDSMFKPIDSGTGGTDGGVDWTARPDTMAIWVKRQSPKSEAMHLLYYAWRGNSHNDKYKSKGGGCVGTSHTNEESDICKSDANSCKTPSGDAVQVAEGWYKSTSDFSEWTEIKVPIKYFNSQRPEKMNIILSGSNYPNKRQSTSMNTSSVLLVDDISLIYSSKVYEMRIDGYAYSKFDKDVFEYYYELDDDHTPVISCYRSERQLTSDEMTINYVPKDQGPTTVTVKADDGSSTTTYSIYFVSRMDTDPYMKSIKINGVELPGYNPYITEYEIEMPYGSEHPEIDVEKSNDKQSFTISEFTIPGEVIINTYAQNKDYSATYRIKIKCSDLTDTTLKDILVNGESIKGFLPTKTIYKVELPEGTTGPQQITYISAYPDGAQHIEVDSRDINDISVVRVSAPGAKQVREYRISYYISGGGGECDDPSENRLENIMIDGITIEDYDPDVIRYKLKARSDGGKGVISYQKRCEESTVTVNDNPFEQTTTLKVVSKSGVQRVYTLNFSQDYYGEKNRLKSIIVNGNPIKDFSPNIFDYTVDIYERDSLIIDYVKNYDIQSVAVASSDKGEAIIKVLSNQIGVDDVTYRLHFNKHAFINALKSIKIDGKEIEGFEPSKLKYVVGVRNTPKNIEVETEVPGAEVIKEVKTNHITLKTLDLAERKGVVYHVYIHYIDDIIPNSDFDNWGKCSFHTSADKPTGWGVPADNENTYGRFDTKFVVEKGDGHAVLKTVRNYWSLAGKFPGFITLGDVTVKFKAAGKTITEVSGGITFRNSPDFLDMRYNPVSNDLISDNNIHMKCTFKGDDKTKEYYFEDKYFDNQWKVKRLELKDKPECINQMNIFINSSKHDNAKDYGYYANAFDFSSYDLCSKLLVDYVKFVYSSKITSIKVNGKSAIINGTEAMVIVDSESSGLPILDITGEVEDQMYDITYGEYNDDVRIIKIRSYAEDMSYTDYTLRVARSKSSSVGIKAIYINGEPFNEFDPERHQYTYQMPAGSRYIPDVVFCGASANQINMVEYKDGTLTVNAYPESSLDYVSYSIKFETADTDVANLKSINIEGRELQFSPDTTYYYVKRKAGEVRLPAVSFEKFSVGQNVIMEDKGTEGLFVFNVTSEAGDNNKIYKVEFGPVPSEINTLDMIYYDGTPVSGFSPDVNEYVVTLPCTVKNMPDVTYDLTEPEKQSAKLDVYDYDDKHRSVIITVTSESGDANVYKVDLEIELDNEARLKDLQVFGKTIAGFNPDSMVYDIELKAYSDSSLIPYVDDIKCVTMSEEATVDISQVKREHINIKVTSPGGVSRIYVVRTTIKLSDNTLLDNIYYKDVAIDGFSPDVRDYYIKLPFGSNSVDKELVTYDAQDDGQSVMVVKGDSDSELLVEIQVVAQDGVHKSKYVIHFIPDSFDPTNIPSVDDVCIVSTPDGGWKFTTRCKNIYVMITDLAGAPKVMVELQSVDPNFERLDDPMAEGYVFYGENQKVYTYNFLYMGNKRIVSGKFKCSRM